MTDKEVLDRAAGCLRLKGNRLPSPIREQLRREHYVDDAKLDEQGFQRLLDRGSQLLAKARRRRYRDARKNEAQELKLGPPVDPREAKRAQVFAGELGRLAVDFGSHRDANGNLGVRPMVVAFREDYLGGQVLTPDEARRFIDSVPLRFLSRAEIRRLGIPFVGHRFRVTSDKLKVVRYRVPRSGAGDEVRRDPFREIHFEFLWKGKRRKTWVQVNFRRAVFDGKAVLEDLLCLDWQGNPTRVRVLPGSVLSELKEVSAELAKHFLWHEAEATWFVLTGRPPRQAECVDVSLEYGGRKDFVLWRLSLSVYLWVSAKTVMRKYRQLQKHFLRRDNRQPRLDRLELFDFIAQRWHAGLPWRQIMEEWNQAHSRRKDKRRDVRNFQHDFEQLYRLLVRGLPVASAPDTENGGRNNNTVPPPQPGARSQLKS